MAMYAVLGASSHGLCRHWSKSQNAPTSKGDVQHTCYRHDPSCITTGRQKQKAAEGLQEPDSPASALPRLHRLGVAYQHPCNYHPEPAFPPNLAFNKLGFCVFWPLRIRSGNTSRLARKQVLPFECRYMHEIRICGTRVPTNSIF